MKPTKMKYFNILCIVSCLLLFGSCKDDKRSTSSPNTDNWGTFLTTTINGEEFSSSVKIVTFRANNQTYLTTADNPDSSEFAFNLIIENNNENDPEKMRYGFVEKEDENEKNIIWKVPNNFDFTSSLTEAGKYLEGTFSFTANAINGIHEDKNNQLVITNGKFKAFKTR